MLFQLRQNHIFIRSVKIHLVHEDENRHVVARKQPPKRLAVRLHAITGTDYQNGVILHLQGALRLRRKVDMPRSIEQRYLHILSFEHRLL